MTIQRKAPKKKVLKRKVAKQRNPETNIDNQLKKFVLLQHEVFIHHPYGSFFGCITYSKVDNKVFTLNTYDPSIFFVFDSKDVKNILPITKDSNSPIIVLK